MCSLSKNAKLWTLRWWLCGHLGLQILDRYYRKRFQHCLAPSLLGRHWYRSHDKISQTFPPCFLIFFKNWMVERPGNKVNYDSCSCFQCRFTWGHGWSPLDDKLDLCGSAFTSQVHLLSVVVNLDCKGTFMAWRGRRITKRGNLYTSLFCMGVSYCHYTITVQCTCEWDM